MNLATKVLNNEIGLVSMAQKRRIISFLKDHIKVAKEGDDFHTTKEALKFLGVSIEDIRKCLGA